MDFNGDVNATDPVFIVTGGGAGLGGAGDGVAARRHAALHLQPRDRGGTSSGSGESSYFFGFVSNTAPTDVGARIESNVASGVFPAARRRGRRPGPRRRPHAGARAPHPRPSAGLSARSGP